MAAPSDTSCVIHFQNVENSVDHIKYFTHISWARVVDFTSQWCELHGEEKEVSLCFQKRAEEGKNVSNSGFHRHYSATSGLQTNKQTKLAEKQKTKQRRSLECSDTKEPQQKRTRITRETSES